MYNLKQINIMAVFSTNQNHHLFVANEYKEVADAKAAKTFSEGAKAGTIAVRQSKNCVKPTIYFLYQGATTPLKSDYIPVENISYIKASQLRSLGFPSRPR